MFLNTKNNKNNNSKKQKLYLVGSLSALLAACGGGGGGTPTNTTDDIKDDNKNKSNISGKVSSGNDEVILGTDGQSSNVNSGDGDDKITGGQSADTIRGGAGADNIYGGAGEDNIVIVGITKDTDISQAKIANARFATDLTTLLSEEDVTNNVESDLKAGETIDGGEDGAILITIGQVDFSGVTLKNINAIKATTEVAIDASTLENLIENDRFTKFEGDNTHLKITNPNEANHTIDFGKVEVTGVKQISLTKDVKLKLDAADLSAVTKIDGEGYVQILGDLSLIDNIEIGRDIIILDKDGNFANSTNFKGEITSGDDFLELGIDGNASKVDAGAGDDRIIGGDEADIIRGGSGADHIEAGAGQDKIVILGVTKDKGLTLDDLSNPRFDTKLDNIFNENDITNNLESDLSSGEYIDAGADGGALITVGDVDFTDVTLKNISEIQATTEVKISAEQLQSLLDDGNFAKLQGENTHLIITNADGNPDEIDFSAIDMTGVTKITVADGVTLKLDAADYQDIGQILGDGIVEVTGSDQADVIKLNSGADKIDATAGDDKIVILGVTKDKNLDQEDISNDRFGTDLSKLVSNDELTHKESSDLTAGQVIDAGTDGGALISVGDVDFTDVTLKNISEIQATTEVKISAEQLQSLLDDGNFAKLQGDSTHLIITNKDGNPDEINFSAVDMTGVTKITVADGVTLKLDAADYQNIDQILGNGIVEVTGSDQADVIKLNSGADKIDAAAGDDKIIILGVTKDKGLDQADISNDRFGTDLSNVISNDVLTSKESSDLASGQVIDAGADGGAIIAVGDVDFTSATLKNISEIQATTEVKISAEQLQSLLDDGNFAKLQGDDTHLIITNAGGNPDVIDFSAIDMSGVTKITVVDGVTLKLDAADYQDIDQIFGDGIVEVTGSDQADVIKLNPGADKIDAAAGDDKMVILGVTKDKGLDQADISNDRFGADLSKVVSNDELINKETSDLQAGQVIDAGADGGAIIAVGDVDLTGATLKNISEIQATTEVKISVEQLQSLLDDGNFAKLQGENTHLIITNADGDPDVIDFSAIDMTGVTKITVADGVTLKLDAADYQDLDQILGDGIVEVTGSDQADVIKLNPDADKIDAAKGDDKIVILGITKDKGLDQADISNDRFGADLSKVVSNDELTNKESSDLASGQVIDAGADGGALITVGDVDFTNVTLKNISEIQATTEIKISAEQLQSLLDDGNFAKLQGEDTHLIITNKDGNPDAIDFSNVDMTGVAELTLADGITLKLDAADLADLTKLDGSGSVQLFGSTDDLNHVEVSPNITILDLSGNEILPEIDSENSLNANIDFNENQLSLGDFKVVEEKMIGKITYSLEGDDAALFTIDANTGAISFKQAPDFENAQDVGGDNVYDIKAVATDNRDKSISQDVQINVQNVNENPVFAQTEKFINLSENTLSVGQEVAQDFDAGAVIKYSLTGDDAALFNINEDSGEISFKQAASFETAADLNGDNIYSFNIIATDEHGLTASKAYHVTIEDENEAPKFVDATTSFELEENKTFIANLSAHDDDIQNGDELTYSLSGDDAALFNIDSKTGALSLKQAQDFESPDFVAKTYQLKITVTDKLGLNSQKDIEVTITDVNEKPVFELTEKSINFAENQTSVGTFSASDQDIKNGDAIRYSLEGDDAELFEVNAETGQVSFKTNPNFEEAKDQDQDNVYEFSVVATDKVGLKDTQNISLNLTDVNDIPIFTNDKVSFSIDENSTAIGNLNATDQDGDTLNYSLTGVDADLFAIDVNGNISFKNAPNFEDKKDVGADNVYNLTVNMNDGHGGTASRDITVTVNDLNEKPVFALANKHIDLAENQTSVGTFAASDDDVVNGDEIRYSLSGDDADLFEIDAATGQVSFKSNPNFEDAKDQDQDNVYEFIVTATDKAGQNSTQTIALNLTDVNEAPIFTNEKVNFSIDENSTAIIGNLNASDQDGDTLNYSLTGADAALFTIDKNGNIQFKQGANFEDAKDVGADNIYNLTINMNDGNGGTASRDITINVNDINENPVFDEATKNVQILENQTSVSTELAQDFDKNAVIKYSLKGDDATLFSINEDSGIITLNDAPNFEDAQDKNQDNVYKITVVATDEHGLTAEKDLNVEVQNENEAPVYAVSPAAYELNENETLVGSFTANDVDVTSGDQLTYTLEGADNDLFTIDATTGALSLKQAQNFEADGFVQKAYQLTIRATDKAGLNTSKDISVTIVNVNEGPEFDAAVKNISFAEHQSALGNFTAVDEDVKHGDEITYSLSGHDANLFNLDSVTGAISFKNPANFEQKLDHNQDNVYNIIVTATDKADVTVHQTLSISVTDVNDLPVFNNANVTFSIAENNKFIGNLNATDEDGDNLTYTLSGNDAALFEITANGNISFKQDANFENKLDHDDDNIYELTVSVDDGNGGTDQQDITINVTDVNEAPIFAETHRDITITENTTEIATEIAQDFDKDAVVKYSLKGDDAALFTVNEDSGEISLIEAADFETARDKNQDNIYKITLVATDEHGLTAEKTFNIEVENENEAPKYQDATTAYQIEENKTFVGNIAAVDVDVTSGDALTYTLSGADEDLFEINSQTGALSLKTAIDFEDDNFDGESFELTVTATDKAGLTTSKNITVTVTNVNEKPVFDIAEKNIEFSENQSLVGTFAATDQDTKNGDVIRYSLSGVDANIFNIDQDTGQVSFKNDANFENPLDQNKDNLYQITVTATDKEGLNSSQNLNINVTNENDAPVFKSDKVDFSIPEKSQIVGDFSATDEDGDAITYSLAGVDAECFVIDANGNLRFKEEPDYESPDDKNDDNVYDVTIVATDEHGLKSEKQIEVDILDLDEPSIGLKNPSEILKIGAGETINFDLVIAAHPNQPDAILSNVEVRGVPNGVTFNKGVLENGVLKLDNEDINGLTMSVDNSFNGNLDLTLMVTSTSPTDPTQVSTGNSDANVSVGKSVDLTDGNDSGFLKSEVEHVDAKGGKDILLFYTENVANYKFKLVEDDIKIYDKTTGVESADFLHSVEKFIFLSSSDIIDVKDLNNGNFDLDLNGVTDFGQWLTEQYDYNAPIEGLV